MLDKHGKKSYIINWRNKMNKQALKDKIKDLEQTAEFKEKEVKLRLREVQLDERENRRALYDRTISAEAKVEQLNARINEHPYKQLTDLLKAIAVKLPELNIKELAIHTKCKK